MKQEIKQTTEWEGKLANQLKQSHRDLMPFYTEFTCSHLRQLWSFERNWCFEAPTSFFFLARYELQQSSFCSSPVYLQVANAIVYVDYNGSNQTVLIDLGIKL